MVVVGVVSVSVIVYGTDVRNVETEVTSSVVRLTEYTVVMVV